MLLVLGDEKFTAMADAPFMKEAGLPPMQVISWTGIAVPAAAPRDAKLWLRRHFIEALNDPELRKQLEGLSAQVPPTNTDPDKFVGEQLRLWTDAARMGGISAPQ